MKKTNLNQSPALRTYDETRVWTRAELDRLVELNKQRKQMLVHLTTSPREEFWP